MSSTKFVFFRADRKNKMAVLASDSTSLKPLNGIQRKMRGNKISTSSAKFVFFGPIGKTRCPPWPLIGWDIFDFSSETAKRNSTKLDRKQDLSALYQVCVFSGRSEKQDGRPWPLIDWDIFDFSETAERNSAKHDRKQDHNVLCQVCVFQADRINKMAALASDWLRHFQLLLWNRWTEFNETWQKAISQCFKQESFTKRWQKYRPLFDNWNHFLCESGRESCPCGGMCIHVYI